LMVANDSGMIHMGAAADIPVIALFGPMDPNQWRPLCRQSVVMAQPHLPCRPCRMNITCDNRYPCLTEITPQKVFEACKAYLTS
jgi:ADP-heptose:LPS heptosyltransferase